MTKKYYIVDSITSETLHCETEPPEQVWPDISMRGDAGGAPSLSAPHWAECADDGRISTNLLPAQPSPAQPSPAQPSPAQHRYEG